MSSLVIYFSRSGENYFGGELKNIEKGNTEVIAEYIQELDGADLFKVEPANEYPADYMKCIDVAKKGTASRCKARNQRDIIRYFRLRYNLHRFSELVGNSADANVYTIGTT